MKYRYVWSWWSSLLLLGSCSVYVPMQGAAPNIRAKGEAEVAASWSLTNRVEFSAAYSPLPHVLVRAATSLKGRVPTHPDSSNYLQNNQYELALGTYWPLSQHWLVGGLAGFGQAHAQARYQEDGFSLFGDPVQHQFDAIYSKYSGEAYLTYQPNPLLSLGLSYRLVQLRLTDATDQGMRVESAAILRHEPMFFCRLRLGAESPLQLQVATGASSTLRYSEQTADDRLNPARQFKTTRSYVSVGVALLPHLLWSRK
jgi:hypothetical protein